MASLARPLIRHCSTSSRQSTSSKLFTKPFEDLCYKYLLAGQYKQHCFRRWLFEQPHNTQWKVSLKDETFALHSDTDTCLRVPLHILGTYSKEHKSLLLGHWNQQLVRQNPSTVALTQAFFRQFTEINDGIASLKGIVECDENLAYVYGALMVATTPNINGYSVGSFPYRDQPTQQPTIFVLISQLAQHIEDYDQQQQTMEEENIDADDLMNIWHFTFSFMCKQCGLSGLTDNVRIFENFFAFQDTKMEKHNVTITDFDNGTAINAIRLSLHENVFQINDMDFDEQHKQIRRINGMDFRTEQLLKCHP